MSRNINEQNSDQTQDTQDQNLSPINSQNRSELNGRSLSGADKPVNSGTETSNGSALFSTSKVADASLPPSASKDVSETNRHKVVEILNFARPLSQRLLGEGPNLPLNTLTTQDRKALEDFESVRAYHQYGQLIELAQQAGMGADEVALLERLYNRIRTIADPMEAAKELDALNKIQNEEQGSRLESAG